MGLFQAMKKHRKKFNLYVCVPYHLRDTKLENFISRGTPKYNAICIHINATLNLYN